MKSLFNTKTPLNINCVEAWVLILLTQRIKTPVFCVLSVFKV